MTLSTKLKVGLVGEAPNDTDALKVLLERRYADRIQCVALGRRLKGDKLADKTDHLLRILTAEYARARPDVVIVSRDLDALASDTTKQAERLQEFNRINPVVGGAAVFLLHIYELEALIAAHPEVVRQHYKVTYNPQVDVMRIEDPKGKLKRATEKCKYPYKPDHAATLLAQIDYDRLLTRCRYFAKFDQEFSARLATPKRRA